MKPTTLNQTTITKKLQSSLTNTYFNIALPMPPLGIVVLHTIVYSTEIT